MFNETFGNIWDFHHLGWIGITTNGVVTRDGELVMGGGIALEAAQKFPELPSILARCIEKYGNVVCLVPEYQVFSFPTKEHWKDPSPIELVKKSAQKLAELMDDPIMTEALKSCFLVPPGCGLGGLDYGQQVRPLLVEYFKDTPCNLTIVDFKKD